MSGRTNGPFKCDLKVKRFRLWQIASRNILSSWWPLAEIVLHWVPSVISEPGLLKFLGWFNLFQCFEICIECSTVMQTKQTNSLEDWEDSCEVQLEAQSSLVQALGCLFFYLPRKCCGILQHLKLSRVLKVHTHTKCKEKVSKLEGQTIKKMTQILTEPVGQSGWRGRDGDW